MVAAVANLIGRTRLSNAAIFRTHGIAPFRNILTPDHFKRIHPASPSHKAVLVPEVVFWMMASVAMAEGTMAGGAVSFWGALLAVMPQLPLTPVTEEAFCIARGALPLRFFLQVFADVVARFSRRFDSALRWKNHRLLGVDGCDVELPNNPHLRRIFPPQSNQHGSRGHPQGRLVGLVGLWSGVCYAFRWTNLAVGEQPSARRLFGYLTALDLLLADRNFADLATFAGILARKADFLIHLPSNRFLKKVRLPTPSGLGQEWYVRLNLPADVCQRHPGIRPIIVVRILQYQIPGYRPSWLITSLLDTAEYSYEELVALYHDRWRQETFHREWKYTLQLSNLRSHTATGLLKEVLVQLTLNNVVRWIMADAAPPGMRPVDLKFLEAKRLILASMPPMTTAGVFDLLRLYDQLLNAIGRQRIIVRPSRNYPRRWDAKGRPRGHGRIVTPAKLPTNKENAAMPI